MTKREITLRVPQATIDRMGEILEREELDREDQDQKFFSITAEFGDGFEADIEVCSGQSNAFLNPVLFLNGQEIACIQDCSEHLDGEYCWSWKDQEFVVNIVPEEAA